MVGFQQKGEVIIDDSNGIAREGACVGRHWEFEEFFGLWCRITAVVFATLITHLNT